MNACSLYVAIVLSLAAVGPAADVSMFKNPSFERGLEGWSVRGDPSCVGVAERTALHGTKALVFDTRKGGAYARVRQTVKNEWPGRSFELSYSFRYVPASSKDAPQLLPGLHDYGAVSSTLRYFKGVGKRRVAVETIETFAAYYYPFVAHVAFEDGWITRTESLKLPREADAVELTLTVGRFPGKVYLDHIRLREVAAFKRKANDMWCYNPLQAKLGKSLKARVKELFASKSPFIEAADVYNGLLTQSALALDEAKTLLRAAAYAREPETGMRAVGRVMELEKELNVVYRTFQDIFFEKKPELLAQRYYPLAARLEPKIRAERSRIAKQLRRLQDKQGWRPRPESGPKPYVISPGGAPNQITFGKLSKDSHHFLERHMGLNQLRQSNHFLGLRRIGRKPIDYLDWRGALKLHLDFIKAHPDVKYLGLGTTFAAHRGAAVSRGWFNAHKDDPDVLLSGALGRAVVRDTACPQVNWWHPAVRAEVRKQAVAAAKAVADRPEVLYLAFAQEAGGPKVDTAKGRCAAGAGPHALKSFHAYLERRYGSIERLNARWKTHYPSFDAVELQPKDPPGEGAVGPTPLRYWLARWRMASYMDWLKFIYDAFKEGAPDKPVMSSINRMRVDAARLFEHADIVGFHSGYPEQWVYASLIQSMRRFAGKEKSMGQFETTWACQGTRGRPGDERVQRAGLVGHAYRMALHDMHVQHFWYAYTGQPYMLFYNGNWFTPSTDALAYRYSAGGMRVAVENLRRLGEVFTSTRKAETKILMIYWTTTNYQGCGGGSRRDEIAMWELLGRNNIEHEFLPEEFIDRGRAKLRNYDVVILPFAPYMTKRTAARLIDWTRRGGTLIALGPCGVYDELGFPTGKLMKKLFGFVPNATGPLSRGAAVWRGEKLDGNLMCIRPFGKGTAVYVKHELRDTLRERRQAERILVDAILKKAERFAVCAGNRLQLFLRRDASGKRFLFAYNQSPREIVSDRVILAARCSSVVDVAVPGAFPVPLQIVRGRTEFAVTLAPGQLAVFEIDIGKDRARKPARR